MHNSRLWFLGLGIAALVLFTSAVTRLQTFESFVNATTNPVELIYPKNWPKPTYDFTKKPLTREGIELGRLLFYDPILSRDSTISCASCHLSFTAFTHVDHAVSHGIEDRIGRRNSMALTNLAWSQSFMWDGAINHLDFQALAPMSDSTEMDEKLENVVRKLNQSPRFRTEFFAAFGDSLPTGERLLKAISQFELTLISANSKYDRMMAGRDTFTRQEKNGYLLFQKNCANCHTEPLFTNLGFEKNGLPIDTSFNDFGRMRITHNPLDSLKFKVPSLRNIEFSQPYMHDGRFKKLRQVVEHYSQTDNISPKITLSANEKVDLVAFLLTLTDRAYLFNPDFSFPKK
jgi:cytochrome c peroxidase